MNVAAVATQLLTYFSPEERSVPDSVNYPGRNAAVALAMNGALQELFGEASPWVRYDERGMLLNAPTPVTISVTQGSTDATISAGWQSWMAGCSIVIANSAFDNAIRNDSSSVVLKIPHDGPTGSVSAMVYHDALTLPADVMRVHGPVQAFNRTIGPLVSGEFPFVGRGEEDFGFHRRLADPPDPLRVAERAAQPLGYAIETWSKDAVTAPRIRMLLQPSPDRAGMLTYRAMLAPPLVVSDLTSTVAIPVPLGFVQSVFFPVALQRLSASSFFRSDGAGMSAEIERAYQAAMGLLKKTNPRTSAGTSLRAVY